MLHVSERRYFEGLWRRPLDSQVSHFSSGIWSKNLMSLYPISTHLILRGLKAVYQKSLGTQFNAGVRKPLKTGTKSGLLAVGLSGPGPWESAGWELLVRWACYSSAARQAA